MSSAISPTLLCSRPQVNASVGLGEPGRREFAREQFAARDAHAEPPGAARSNAGFGRSCGSGVLRVLSSSNTSTLRVAARTASNPSSTTARSTETIWFHRPRSARLHSARIFAVSDGSLSMICAIWRMSASSAVASAITRCATDESVGSESMRSSTRSSWRERSAPDAATWPARPEPGCARPLAPPRDPPECSRDSCVTRVLVLRGWWSCPGVRLSAAKSPATRTAGC